MLYLLLVLIVAILLVLLLVKWSKPLPTKDIVSGTLEDEIEMKTKELAILRKKKELASTLNKVNEEIAKEIAPTPPSTVTPQKES
jgi:hypothetical protein